MPKRLRYGIAILALFGLNSCDREPSFKLSDSDRIAALEDVVNQHARASTQMVNRVERDEARIEALEAEVRNLR